MVIESKQALNKAGLDSILDNEYGVIRKTRDARRRDTREGSAWIPAFAGMVYNEWKSIKLVKFEPEKLSRKASGNNNSTHVRIM